MTKTEIKSELDGVTKIELICDAGCYRATASEVEAQIEILYGTPVELIANELWERGGVRHRDCSFIELCVIAADMNGSTLDN